MLFASTHCFGESWDYCLEMHSEKSEARVPFIKDVGMF